MVNIQFKSDQFKLAMIKIENKLLFILTNYNCICRENSDNQADTETVHSIFKLHLPEKTGYDKENQNYTHFYKDVTDFALIELTE